MRSCVLACLCACVYVCVYVLAGVRARFRVCVLAHTCMFVFILMISCMNTSVNVTDVGIYNIEKKHPL